MDDIERRFSEFFIKGAQAQGLGDGLFPRIYSLLFISPEEIALDEIAKKTGYSLASISNTVRMLEATRIVERRKKPGSKKVYLYASKDIIGIYKEMLVKKYEAVVVQSKFAFPSILSEARQKAKTQKQKRTVKIMEGYYDQMQRLGRAMKKMIAELDKV